MENFEYWITVLAVVSTCTAICVFCSVMVLITIKQKLDDVARDMTKIKQNTGQKGIKKKPLDVHVLQEKPTIMSHCPNCDELIFGEKAACDKCGQLLDWDNKTEA